MLFLIIMRFIIKPYKIYSISQSIFNGSNMSVEARRCRTGRILPMTNFSQPSSYFRTFHLSLFTYFIADTPHDNRRMIPVATDHSLQVAFRPIIKITMIAIGILACPPFVKSFHLHHKSHTVAQLKKFRRRRIMRCTNGVTSHFLHYFQLTFYRTHIHSSP